MNKPHTTLDIYRLGKNTLGIIFIGSGLIPLWINEADRLMHLHALPLPTSWHSLFFYGLVLLDVICGVICLFKPSKTIWQLLFIVVLGYTVVISIFKPILWLDPFGAMLKNLAILSWLWVMISLEEK